MLLHGDCLTELSQVPDASVQMVFADLPYGVTANKWDVVIPFEPLWDELLRIGKPRCAYVFTGTQPFATNLICSQRKLFRYDLIWEKSMASGSMNACKMPLRAHEAILLFYRYLPVYNPQMRPGNGRKETRLRKPSYSPTYNKHRAPSTYVNGQPRFPRSVVYFDKCRDKNGHNQRMHPTQKPVALLEWLIKTYSNPGDVILDPTMGSGTTGVACSTTGRSFIGIEKDAQYFEVACKRIAEAQAAA